MTRLYFKLGVFLSILFIFSCEDSTSPADNTIVVRKNVKNLTSTEKSDFVNAVLKLKQTKSPYNDSISWYDQFVLWHREAFQCDESNHDHHHNSYPAHMGPAFLPWHRAFLLEFEHALQSVSGKKIALPYWDWTDETSTSAVFADDFMGGNGDPNEHYTLKTGPFKKGNWKIFVMEDENDDPFQWDYLVRALGVNPAKISLPTKDQITEMLAIERYDHPPYNNTVSHTLSFRNYLEGFRNSRSVPCNNGDMDVTDDNWEDSTNSDGIGSAMHNAVHVWVGGVFKVDTAFASGTMSFSVSPNDPVFFIHHANVDRMWTLWMKKHGQTYEPESGGPTNTNLNDLLPPFSNIGRVYTPKMMLDSRKIGFYYQEEEVQ